MNAECFCMCIYLIGVNTGLLLARAILLWKIKKIEMMEKN